MLVFSFIFVVFVDTLDNIHEAQYRRLSLDIKVELLGLPYADLIEERTVQLVNSPLAIVNAPSAFKQQSKHYLVAGKEKKLVRSENVIKWFSYMQMQGISIC